MQIRSLYNKNLKNIQDEIMVMGGMVVDGIARAIEALKTRNPDLANRIVEDDKLIKQKRFEIEEKCVNLVVTQQPVAGDLRLIIAALNIIVDMQRIGDYTKSIARIAIELGNEPPLKPLIDIPRMADKAIDMLRRSIKAYINFDAEMAREIAHEDKVIDDLYDQIYRELLLIIMSNPNTTSRATSLLWIAYNLERTGGRITNICERIVYLTTGKMEEIATSKY